jgi:predicted RNA binding protein YcfA (HicA-like mRNA interferase family)
MGRAHFAFCLQKTIVRSLETTGFFRTRRVGGWREGGHNAYVVDSVKRRDCLEIEQGGIIGISSPARLLGI